MALYGSCLVCGYGFGAGTKKPEMIGMMEYVCTECKDTDKFKEYMNKRVVCKMFDFQACRSTTCCNKECDIAIKESIFLKGD
jgi:hypothetical protein